MRYPQQLCFQHALQKNYFVSCSIKPLQGIIDRLVGCLLFGYLVDCSYLGGNFWQLGASCLEDPCVTILSNVVIEEESLRRIGFVEQLLRLPLQPIAPLKDK